MKRYLLLLVIIPLLTCCGAGGGGGTANGNSGGDNGSNSKSNPPVCPSKSKVAKVKIKEDGVYKITYSDLNNACIDLSGAELATLKMTAQGEEIAIDVVDGNKDGRFDDGDSIEFYGRAIPRGDNRFRFTETNVYWISAEDGARKRMKEVPSNPQATQGPASFLRVLHMEDDTWYEQKNYPEVTAASDVREHWFWGEVFYVKDLRDYNFSMRYIDKTQPIYLKLRLQSVSGNHHIRGYINNQSNIVIDENWSGQEPFELEVPVNASYLNNGPNVFKLESVGDTSSGIYEIFYLDWFEMRYNHAYQAEYDMLEFTGKDLITLANFTSNDISLYEISDYANVQKIIPLKVEGTASGYSTVFSASQESEGKYFALSAAKKKTPFAIEGYTPANLRAQKADYIIITHEDFYDSLAPLTTYRTSGAGGGMWCSL